MKNKCLICHSKVVDKFEPVADGIEQNCAYCGHFKISNSAAATEWEGDGVIAKLETRRRPPNSKDMVKA